MKRDENNKLYLTMVEATDAGISYNTISKARTRGSKSMKVIIDWADGNARLLEYESLSQRYKKMIENHFGDPYDYEARQPIKEMVVYDEKAEHFFLSYRFEGSRPLPHDKVLSYSWAASWLNMIKKVDEDKSIIKVDLNLTVDQFYGHVSALLSVGNIELPTSYRRLRKSLLKYTSNGFESLISARFGNTNNAKLVDNDCEDMLVSMIEHPLQYDDVFIKVQYNKWAKKEGYKEISTATVRRKREEHKVDISIRREGNSVYKGKYAKQAKGIRPSQPLYLIESDDNHLDLHFTELAFEGNKKNDYRKYKAIVVTDSFNDYPLGFAYSLNLTTEVVRAAYISAMHYLRMLTGHWILPHETKTDRWAQKELVPFYQSIGYYVPAAPYNKHRGYIEQFFGTKHWERCLKVGSNNYTGHNITTPNPGVNRDWINSEKANRPLIDKEAYNQIDAFFHRLRHMEEGETGISKHEEWMKAYNKMPETEKRIITDEQFLLKFGIEHNYRGKGIEITNRGVEPQINGVEYSFDLEHYDPRNNGKSVSIYYDPFDMNQVLVTNHEDVRMMAYSAIRTPRALKDHSEGTRLYLNSLLQANLEQVEGIAARQDARAARLKANSIDPEAALLDLSLSKEIRQSAAEEFLMEPNVTAQRTLKAAQNTKEPKSTSVNLADLM